MGMKIPGITGSPVPAEIPFARYEPPPGMEARRAPEVPSAYSREDLQRSVQILEQATRLFNKRLQFHLNEEIDRVVVKVIDGQTDKVIKEIPPAEVQRLIARIEETIGLLFDQRI